MWKGKVIVSQSRSTEWQNRKRLQRYWLKFHFLNLLTQSNSHTHIHSSLWRRLFITDLFLASSQLCFKLFLSPSLRKYTLLKYFINCLKISISYFYPHEKRSVKFSLQPSDIEANECQMLAKQVILMKICNTCLWHKRVRPRAACLALLLTV